MSGSALCSHPDLLNEHNAPNELNEPNSGHCLTESLILMRSYAVPARVKRFLKNRYLFCLLCIFFLKSNVRQRVGSEGKLFETNLNSYLFCLWEIV
jgi:hypothetical protein